MEVLAGNRNLIINLKVGIRPKNIINFLSFASSVSKQLQKCQRDSSVALVVFFDS